MNTDNLSALAVGIAVVALIAGFAVYFNNPALNKPSSAQAAFVPGVITVSHNQTKAPGGNMTAGNSTTVTTVVHIDKSQFRMTPELAGISGYINTSNFTLASLKGKVVLVDFWTYSCINCIRTIPYLNSWYDKYQKDGLVIVGVHSPEFDFEKNYDNVKAAVDKFGIKYPVVQDNDHATWNAFKNNYWPRHYLIDTEGYIRSDHIGEGGYAETEQQIQSLLAEKAALAGSAPQIDMTISSPNATSVDFGKIATPEIYLGYGFAREPLGNQEGFRPDQVETYALPESVYIAPNHVFLEGTWKNNNDNMQLVNYTGKVVLQYSAKSVNIVAGGTGKVYVSQDGGALAGNRGSDVGRDGSFTIDGHRLYNVVNNSGYEMHTVTLDILGPGFQIYTFTFG